jgi:glucokinase
MTRIIAIDVGGTQMRAAVYLHQRTTPLRLERIATHTAEQTPLDRLVHLIESVWDTGGRVDGIAIAVPGPLDPNQGVLMKAANIPGWENLPLRHLVEGRFGVPVALGNDANLAALGEWRFGAGQGHHHLIYITVSTGIGGGVIVDDRLLLGRSGLAAEIGHISVMVDGPLCGCGKRGHLEAVASGTAIAHWASEQLDDGAPSILAGQQPVSSRQVGEAASQGDPLAVAAIHRAGEFLGRAVADFLHIFNPSIVIFGGGVSHTGELLFEPMRASLRQHVLTPEYLQGLTLTTAALGDDAGLLGALALGRELCKV